MFQSKKPDGAAEQATPSHPATHTTNAATMATNAKSFAAHAAASENGSSIINEWLMMRGDLESAGDILVKGKVHGNIVCKLLVIDTEGVIEGTIRADEVVIRGTTRGLIQARRVRIERTANVESEIYQEVFSVEEGARLKGALAAFEDYVATAAPPNSLPEPVERAVTASLYHLLDQARSAQHSHMAVAQ